MPIGSHHTWIGLLFTQGLTGFCLFFTPVVWSLIGLSLKAKSNPIAHVALKALILVTFASFSDNIEKLAYLYQQSGHFLNLGLKPAFHG